VTSELGKYTLVRPLAQGGMAEVWLARYAGPGGFEKTAVIKRILPHLTANADFVQMFLDEARIAARLSHPNVVQVFDFGEAEGSYFLCMEHLVGEDVATLIRLSEKRKRHLPPAVTALILSAACDALHYAHTLCDDEGQPLNIVHRDVSPSNVFVTYQGAVKVLDFGIAKAEGKLSQTQGGVLKGKFVYMSPEQIRGKPLDGRSDVFALGAVLAEMLTGQRLFYRENELGILAAITEDPIPSMGELAPGTPAELDAIVQRALSRDREARFADAHQMRHALEEFVAANSSTPATTLLQNFMRELVGEQAIREKSRPVTGGALRAPGGALPRQPSSGPKARPPSGPIGRQPSGRPPSGGDLARPPSGSALAKPPSGPRKAPAPVEPDGESTPPLPVAPDAEAAGGSTLSDAQAPASLLNAETVVSSGLETSATQEAPDPSLLDSETNVSERFFAADSDPQVALETVVGARPGETTAPLPVAEPQRGSRLAVFMVLGTLVVAGATWGGLTLFTRPDPAVTAAQALPDPIRSAPPTLPEPTPPAKLSEPPKPEPAEPAVATPQPATLPDPPKPEPEKPIVSVAVAPPEPPKPAPEEPKPAPKPKPEPVAASKPAPAPVAAKPAKPTPIAAKVPPKPIKVAQTPTPAPTPTPKPLPPPEAPKEPAGAPAKLDVNCIPWCHIYVDGKDTGKNSPAFGLDVAAGPHKVKVINPPTGLMQERDVTCVAGQPTKVVVRFE
jgi:serine/threonine-protein kinase